MKLPAKYLLLLPALLLAARTARSEPLSAAESFNTTIGTQTIGASYGFTTEPRLVETARAIQAMGSNTLKFSLALDKGLKPAPRSLAEITRLDPAVKAVLAMPFAHYVLWAYPLSTAGRKLFQKESLEDEYREVYELARALLLDYNGSGKSFYLGNWEGDWHLLHLKPDYVPAAQEIENMAAWAKIRQKAVDDARRDTPHQNVGVFYYLEVNRVVDAIEGKPRLANQVLARVNPDFVSYSSYDALSGDIEANLKRSLDFLESKLAPKAGVEGKRVFIGEYGFPAQNHPPELQASLSRRVMRAGLSWGCPFVLYWEMFNNEVGADGVQRGFWLIDDKNLKQPVYFAHHKFYEQARLYLSDFLKANNRLPTRAEFIQKSLFWLDDPPPAPAAPLQGTDMLLDFSKMQHHSEGLMFDASNPQYFDGRAFRLRRSGADTPQSIVYRLADAEGFTLTAYVFGPFETERGAKVWAQVSDDQKQWRDVPLSAQVLGDGPWRRVTLRPLQALSAGDEYLRVELGRDDAVYSPQLAQVDVEGAAGVEAPR